MKVNAQVVTASPGDYRSIGTGTWENAANWERYVGTVAGWVTATNAPDSSAGVITIRSPHEITFNVSRIVDQVIVESGAKLYAFNSTITIANGAGNDLENNGTCFFASSATINVTSGAVISGSSHIQFDGNAINNGTINVSFLAWGVASQNITGTGNISTLSTPNSAGVVLVGGNQTITSLMNFSNGNVTTGANKLILATTASVQNNAPTECFVNGNLQMNFPAGTSTKTFSIGDGLGYRPADITVFNSNGVGGVTISTNNPTIPILEHPA